MLFHHLFYESNAYGNWTQQVAIVCKVCVSMFLFVSGYGMATQYSKLDCHGVRDKITSTLKFLLRRLLKFYLNYWAIFIITVPLGSFVFGRSLSIAYGTDYSIWSSLVKDILGIQGTESYIVTWWFNALIISLYLLFPLLNQLTERKSIAVGFTILLFLWPRDYVVDNFFYILYLWNSNLAIYTLVFVLGIFSARHIEAINMFLNKIKLQLVLIFSSLTSISLCFARQLFTEGYADLITLDAFITIFVALSIVAFRRMTRLRINPLAILGKHSMNIYLIHTFILMFLFPKFIFECKFSPIIFFVITRTIIRHIRN
jgi:Predicted acyltransferases